MRPADAFRPGDTVRLTRPAVVYSMSRVKRVYGVGDRFTVAEFVSDADRDGAAELVRVRDRREVATVMIEAGALAVVRKAGG